MEAIHFSLSSKLGISQKMYFMTEVSIVSIIPWKAIFGTWFPMQDSELI
jgi:hypothetical protein